MVQPLWETVIKQRTTIGSSNFTSGYIPRITESGHLNVHLHPQAHCSITHNSQKVEATKVSIDKWIGWWSILCVNLTGCPDIWLNIILSMFMKVFLDEINIWNCRLSQAGCPPPPIQMNSSNSLKAWVEQKWWVRQNSYSLYDCLQARTSVFSCLHSTGSGFCHKALLSTAGD